MTGRGCRWRLVQRSAYGSSDLLPAARPTCCQRLVRFVASGSSDLLPAARPTCCQRLVRLVASGSSDLLPAARPTCCRRQGRAVASDRSELSLPAYSTCHFLLFQSAASFGFDQQPTAAPTSNLLRLRPAAYCTPNLSFPLCVSYCLLCIQFHASQRYSSETEHIYILLNSVCS
jgi:hypothetical protein